MKVAASFCPEGVNPFDTVEWDYRSAQIKDENGKVLFEQKDCEIPAQWSALATNVVVSKYFYGEANTSEREKSVRQVIHRVARTIADWGTKDGYFASAKDGETFYRELAWLCLHQYGSFNSPVWFNVGLYHQYGVKGSRGNYRWDLETKTIQRPDTSYEFPQASACFISRSTTTWKTSCVSRRARPCCSSSARERGPTCRRSAARRKSCRAGERRRVRCRSCGCTTRSPPW